MSGIRKILYLYPQIEIEGPIKTYSFIKEDLLALSELKIFEFIVVDAFVKGVQRYKNIKIYGIPSFWQQGWKLLADLLFMVSNTGLFQVEGWQNHILEVFNCVRIEKYLIDVIRENNIDIIDSHGVWPKATGGAIAKRATGIPLFTNLYGGEILATPEIGHGRVLDRFYREMMRRIFLASDMVTVANDYVRKASLKEGCPRGRLRLLQEGVNLDIYKPDQDGDAVREKLGLGGKTIILCVASHTRRKGIDYCIAAVRKVRESFPDVALIISGEGPEEKNLRKMVAETGMANDVRFVNQGREETPSYFAACDMFCLASLQDAAPYVILEASATGKSVVSTRVGGIPDCVIDGETGFLIPPKDVEQLAGKLKLLIENKILREKMGKNGRRYMEEKFSFKKRIADKTDIYLSMGR